MKYSLEELWNVVETCIPGYKRAREEGINFHLEPAMFDAAVVDYVDGCLSEEQREVLKSAIKDIRELGEFQFN